MEVDKMGQQKKTTEFVTVVAVGSSEEEPPADISSGYVTVLKIGDDTPDKSTDEVQIEEVLVYRLPGERLGFGLKFEGGTKASEFVKRLFIQSCAPDSPASRVRGSWGALTEGDEVLEIDEISVKSMTRIDCVRCLKDSNVVIKLLVKHLSACVRTKSIEDLPLVVSAEKKRTPPPPPPVPPRKVPRKKDVAPKPSIENGETPVPQIRQNIIEINGIKNRHQSPRNSGRISQSEVVKRDRKLSDGSIGPPDAEVYLDLFSQESPYCLSESDDTGSSISTVVDRFASFPTTTTSSFAGSLPSTPTANQKRLDLSTLQNPFDNDEIDAQNFESNEYLFKKLVSLQETQADSKLLEKSEDAKPLLQPLQPPANFQDAPLSYADEDIKIVETSINDANNNKRNIIKIDLDEVQEDVIVVKSSKRRPPPPPPRSKHTSGGAKEKNNNEYERRNENEVQEAANGENLPRLVDFVPKSTKSESYDNLKLFIEHERNHALLDDDEEDDDTLDHYSSSNWSEGSNDLLYTFNWSPSTQLATIGEDEEESLQDDSKEQQQQQQHVTRTQMHHEQRSSDDEENDDGNPIVIIEIADSKEIKENGIDLSELEQEDLDAKVEVSVNGDGAHQPQTNGDNEKHHHHQEEQQDQDKQRAPEPAPRKALLTKALPDADIMEKPSINTRQPPDGHEFPDYHEVPTTKTSSTPAVNSVMTEMFSNNNKQPPQRAYSLGRKEQPKTNVKDMIAMFSNSCDVDTTDGEALGDGKKALSKSVMNISTISTTTFNSKRASLDLSNTSSSTTTMLLLPHEKKQEMPAGESSSPNMPPASGRLHMRSQSLIDISDNAKTSPATTDRWAQILEQRRKGLSKLKGLIIPEHPDHEEPVQPCVDLPEIKSALDALPAPQLPPFIDFKPVVLGNHTRNSSTPSLTSPLWNSSDANSTIPKYSPAFKRKTLQVYGTKPGKQTTTTATMVAMATSVTTSDDDECRLPSTLSLNDAPKSLESITSPTRSDCSFEYMSSSSPELKQHPQSHACDDNIGKRTTNMMTTCTTAGKSEDESDNDSAVSSSQSSYVSRTSPPASPNHLHSHYAPMRASATGITTINNSNQSLIEHTAPPTAVEQSRTGSEPAHGADSFSRRLLKPQSVEAINRKNILASAKCRSGKDHKGSPLIQRKFEEDAAHHQQQQLLPEKKKQPLGAAVASETKCQTNKVNGFDAQASAKVAEGKVGEKVSSRFEPVANGIVKHSTSAKDIRASNDFKPSKYISMRNNYTRTSSVTDLRKNFEKSADSTPSPIAALSNTLISKSNVRNARITLNSATTATAAAPNKRNSLPILPSATAIVHKTTALSACDQQKILEECIKDWDETFNKDDLKVVVLHPEIPGGSIGITLAGGTDYETKDITIHKVRNGSAAYRDGRLHKGDRILTINGKSMSGITHAESLAALKEAVAEVVIVAVAGKELSTPVLTPSSRNSSLFDLSSVGSSSPSSSITTPSLSGTPQKDTATTTTTNKRDGEEIVVKLLKDPASGLGFSMEGGKDSPQGDVPLVIKKLFTGGVADKSGMLAAGDELVEINGVDVTCMPRIDAWTLMKKIPPGEVVLRVRR